jgi:hypothetical protein
MKAVLTNADHRSATHLQKKHSHTTHFGVTAVTVLMAIAFLGLVMFLSYLFISGTMAR